MKNLLLCLIFIFTFSIVDYAQSELILSNCNDMLFGVTDKTDVDGDGNICESFVTLQNTGMYTTNMMCDEVNLNWIITIDVDSDGIDDLEYRSDLPTSDVDIDDTNNNGIPDLYIAPTLNGEAQEIEVGNLQGPISTHSVVWKVSDGCNVASECEQIIKVRDATSPIPYCISLSSVVFDTLIDLSIDAADFYLYPYDNCTPSEELRFSFSGDDIVSTRLITYDDVLNSPIELHVYVWDNQDNRDFCSVYLQVFAVEKNIEGYIKTEVGEPIENAEVTLNCNHVEFPRSEFTDSEGYYSFSGLADLVPGCYITVDRPFDYLEDVSTLDFVRIIRHLLGLQPFTTPYQYIAADVNNNNKVSVSDLPMLRRLILGVISEFPTNTSWKFLDKNFEFQNPNDPLKDIDDLNAEPYRIILNPGLEAPYDFIGVKIGNIINY